MVNALLHRCYKYPTATTAEVPQSLKKELSGVCRACFSADAVNKHIDFVKEYKQEFERDLDPESATTFPATLSELTERLKHWKNVLQSNVEDRFPAVLKLEEESSVLRDFHAVDVEIPGQYFTDQVSIVHHGFFSIFGTNYIYIYIHICVCMPVCAYACACVCLCLCVVCVEM